VPTRKDPDKKPRNNLSPEVRGAVQALDEKFRNRLVTCREAIGRLHSLWDSRNEEWSAEDKRWGKLFTDWLYRLDSERPEISKRYLDLFATRPLPPSAIGAFVDFFVEMMALDVIGLSVIGVVTIRWVYTEDGGIEIVEKPVSIFTELEVIGLKHHLKPDPISCVKDWAMEMVRRHRPLVEEWVPAAYADVYQSTMAKHIENATADEYRYVALHPPPGGSTKGSAEPGGRTRAKEARKKTKEWQELDERIRTAPPGARLSVQETAFYLCLSTRQVYYLIEHEKLDQTGEGDVTTASIKRYALLKKK
jgi:hypothetical protein